MGKNRKVIDITTHALSRTRSTAQRLDLQELSRLSGSQILKRIVELDNARGLVQGLSPQDFYWLVKKVGEDDCLPILELGNSRQWHHVMDLEIWKRDRIDLPQASQWMQRLQLADTNELAKWLYTEGQHFAYYYFFKLLEVRIIGHDDPVDLPEGFFTLDGVFYIRVKDPELRESIKKVMEAMASLDLERYHTLLVGLSSVLPAELEEEMFRLRNVRIAEYGFLPFDEAMSVYSMLPPKAILAENNEREAREGIITVIDEEVKEMIPLAPLYHAQETSLLVKVATQTRDHLFLERLRLEFAGLCNQILSAEGLRIDDFEVLVKTCRRAAGYVNLALEKMANSDIAVAETILRNNPLLNVFRVGFGLALRVKWDVERWLKKSWFNRVGLSISFWGDQWSSILLGLLEKKPVYYVGDREGVLYRDFETLDEIKEVNTVFLRCKVLDTLCEQMVQTAESFDILDEETTLCDFLFTRWAKDFLGHGPRYTPLEVEEARNLLDKLREGESSPPYKMERYRDAFVKHYEAFAHFMAEEDRNLLLETLSQLWDEFSEEYQWIDSSAIDPRFTKFLKIRLSP